MAKLSDQIRRWANQPMRPGEGLHVDIFRAAIMLLEAGYDEETTFGFLRKAADRVTDRHVPDREVRGAISSAKDKMAGGTLNTVKWPPYNATLREEIIKSRPITPQDLADSAAALPQDSAYYLDHIYLETDFICLAPAATTFFTVTKAQALANVRAGQVFEYVNPTPMTDTHGLTKEGKASAHSVGNTAPKKFQVVEFDHGEVHEHAAIHWYLARFAPLFMIVYSGGKSLHGWYDVSRMGPSEQVDFFSHAVQIGADPKMHSPCQFSRLPCGVNAKTGRAQSVLLFEPKHLSK
jgi:hypothetical protein